MYNQYKIGKEDKGLLILLSVDDRDIRIEVGAGLEEYINDAKAGRLMDTYAIPKLKEDKFSEGLIQLQEGTIKEINALMNGQESTLSNDVEDTEELETWVSIVVYIVILIIIIIVVAGDGYYGGFSGYSGGGSSGSHSSGFGGRSSGGGASRHF